MKYENVLGEVVEVKDEPKSKIDIHDIEFISFITTVLLFVIPLIVTIITPKIFGDNQIVWMDEQGGIYLYEDTTVPDEVSIMFEGELITIPNNKNLRYACNQEGVNVVVNQVTLHSQAENASILISIITIVVCVILAIFLRYFLLERFKHNKVENVDSEIEQFIKDDL